MSLSDPIADMLTRIRNALRARHTIVNVRASKICTGVCGVLKDEGYIEDFKPIDDGKQGLIRVYLKYGRNGEDVVTQIDRVSRPGCRVYRGSKDLPKVLNGLGISVISTSSGVLSDRQCREKNTGGEVLCTVS